MDDEEYNLLVGYFLEQHADEAQQILFSGKVAETAIEAQHFLSPLSEAQMEAMADVPIDEIPLYLESCLGKDERAESASAMIQLKLLSIFLVEATLEHRRAADVEQQMTECLLKLGEKGETTAGVQIERYRNFVAEKMNLGRA